VTGAQLPRILVVDDDPATRVLVDSILAQENYEVLQAEDGDDAQAILGARDVDVVITDLLMPRFDGIELMRWAAEHASGPMWIILSGVETFDAAVDAIRAGAYEFLSKPPDAHQLRVAVRNGLERRRLLREREQLFAQLESSHRTLVAKVRELEEMSAAMRRDLRRAAIIQRVLLPQRAPPLDAINFHCVYRPGLHVGGDLYNVMRLADGRVGFYVADATGHGVASAMLSVLFHRKLTLRERATGKPLEPAQVLTATNAALCAEHIAPGLFLTVAYGLLDLATGDVRIALAGHPPAVLRYADGSVETFERTGPALGLTADAQYTQHHFTIRAGDRLLLYSDGLLEAGRTQGDDTRWLERALATSAGDPHAVVQGLAAAAAKAAEQGDDADNDDVTVLLLDAHPGESVFDNGSGSVTQPHRPSTRAAAESIFYGESELGSFFVVRGRGTWLNADAFYETALGLLDEAHTIYVDLGSCTYLDSTFLGTLHELVMYAEERAALYLQHVPASIRALFDEMDLQRVSAAIRDVAKALPEVRPLHGAADPQENTERVLRAHEELAALSERNRERFNSVLNAMRDGSAEK
jgi:serine phosphatase RsbU (regulator of sigma subunit)/anti-anti-sigma regulatory factor